LNFDALPVSSEWNGLLVVSARRPKDYDQERRVELSDEEEPPFYESIKFEMR